MRSVTPVRCLATSLPLILACVLATSASAQLPVTRTDSAQALLDARVASGVHGIAAVVVRDGAHTFYAAGVGADSLAVFEIGSVSKTLTGLLLAELVVRGEVSLDDPVSKYLPAGVAAPAYEGREITLADLATHRSGLPRLPGNLRPATLADPYGEYGVDSLFALLGEHALRRRPGSAYEYSNLGAGLLGHVLSLAAGAPYEELVVQRVLEPLGMYDTRITPTPAMAARRVAGHNAVGAPVPPWRFRVLAPAGGWLSTTADLQRLLAALLDPPPGPLGDAIIFAARPRAETGQPGLRIGLGWHIAGTDEDPVVWHNGQTGGFRAFVGYAPARGSGVAVLADTAAPLDDLAGALLRGR